jgi:L-lactate dehydrogenase complex protein LldG
MTDARSEILTRIRQSLPKAYLPDASGAISLPPRPPDFAEPLVDVFTRALEAVQGVVHPVGNQQAARDLLAAEFRARRVSRVLSWESLDWLLPDCKETLAAAGIELIPSIFAGPDRKAELGRLETATVGLTGAAAGLARTGSIVMHADDYHGRLASLLPPVHYVVLYADQLYPDLAAWFSTPGAGPAIGASSNTVIITGPSRTADIAQTLTLGAHGPKELHVVLIG